VTVRMTVAELEQAHDVDLGATDWVEITQQQVDRFADATGDHQWIHVDRERAANGPFGGTIAHGYLTLSMLPALMARLLDITDSAMGVNYGLDRLRLTAPVPVGSKIRARGRLLDATSKSTGVLYRVEMKVEIEGGDRPALVATGLYLVYPQR
jgi:acyl dehydratase